MDSIFGCNSVFALSHSISHGNCQKKIVSLIANVLVVPYNLYGNSVKVVCSRYRASPFPHENTELSLLKLYVLSANPNGTADREKNTRNRVKTKHIILFLYKSECICFVSFRLKYLCHKFF